jgi:hypothetical protein
MEILKKHSVGQNVKILQQLLNIPQTGIFGEKTEIAVKLFQSLNKLKSDGIVGLKTWGALDDLDTDETKKDNLLFEKYYLPNNEYSLEKSTKEYIYLHHTSGWQNPYKVIDGWAKDTRGIIGTEFVIGGQNIYNNDFSNDGKILQAFPEGHYAWHLGKNGNHNMHKNSIGIELTNFGYLVDSKTYTGQIVNENQIAKLNEKFRGFKLWHKYSDNQIKSLQDILYFIKERDSIDIRKGLPELIKKVGTKAFEFNKNAFYGRVKGVWTHTNTRKDKFDCFPQQELLDMLVSLQ